jgi:hypothetical protein
MIGQLSVRRCRRGAVGSGWEIRCDTLVSISPRGKAEALAEAEGYDRRGRTVVMIEDPLLHNDWHVVARSSDISSGVSFDIRTGNPETAAPFLAGCHFYGRGATEVSDR